MRGKLYTVVYIFTTQSMTKMYYAMAPSPSCSWSLWEHSFTQSVSSAGRLPAQNKVEAAVSHKKLEADPNLPEATIMTLTATDTRTQTPSQCITKSFVPFFLENYLSICHLLADMMETDCVAHTCQSIGQ